MPPNTIYLVLPQCDDNTPKQERIISALEKQNYTVICRSHFKQLFFYWMKLKEEITDITYNITIDFPAFDGSNQQAFWNTLMSHCDCAAFGAFDDARQVHNKQSEYTGLHDSLGFSFELRPISRIAADVTQVVENFWQQDKQTYFLPENESFDTIKLLSVRSWDPSFQCLTQEETEALNKTSPPEAD